MQTGARQTAKSLNQIRRTAKRAFLAFLLVFAATVAIACITDSSSVCLKAGTTIYVSTNNVHCVHGGMTNTVPEFSLVTDMDCIVPWTCVTTGGGYFDEQTNNNATCTTSVDELVINPDCSISMLKNVFSITKSNCTSKTPMTDGCPSEGEFDAGCLATIGHLRMLSLTR